MNQEVDYPEEHAPQEGGLSFQEKSLIATIIGSLLIYLIYGWQVLQRYQTWNLDLNEEFVFWGRAILLLILIVTLFEVIKVVLLVIVNAIVTQEEEDPSFVDERDKLIELKGTVHQFAVFGAGFLLAMGAIAIGRPPTVMFVLFMVFMMAAGIIGSMTKLFMYRRGF
jgi:hypothetical protein